MYYTIKIRPKTKIVRPQILLPYDRVNILGSGFGFIPKSFFLTYANFPDAFFKKSFYGLAICFIYQIRV